MAGFFGVLCCRTETSKKEKGAFEDARIQEAVTLYKGANSENKELPLFSLLILTLKLARKLISFQDDRSLGHENCTLLPETN